MKKKYTITSLFIFPLLGIPKSLFDCNLKIPYVKEPLTTRFINSYIKNKTVTLHQEKGVISIVINSYQDPGFNDFFEKLISYPGYIDNYEIGNKIIVLFKIPDQYFDDFEILIKGGYSKIKSEARDLILENSFGRCPNSKVSMKTVSGALFKSEDLRESLSIALETEISKDQEYFTVMILENETLIFDKLEDNKKCSGGAL